jgi:hypothetical protein
MGCNCKKVNNTIRHENGCDCGPNCSCHDCREKYHGNGMGRYDEYPRPKAAMFDPRKIGQAWPEPNNDPLIPYVRANEQGLPYERLNEYKGMRNSLHGWSTLGSTNNSEIVTALLHQIKVNTLDVSQAYSDIIDQVKNQNGDHSEDLIHIPLIKQDYMGGNNPSFKSGKVIPNVGSVFGFIPFKKGNDIGLHIRLWGPEIKKFKLLDDEIRLQTPERDAIHSDPYSRFVDNTYPLYFKMTSPGQYNFEGVYAFASIMLDVIIRKCVYHLSPISSDAEMRVSKRAFPETSPQSLNNATYARQIVTQFINAETQGGVDGFASALSEATVSLLSSDFKNAWASAFYKYEFETFASNEFVFFDPFAKEVFGRFGSDRDLFVSLLSRPLNEAFKNLLTNRYEVFANIYKESFDLNNLREAKGKVAVLESEIQNLKASGGDVDARVVKLQADLNAKINELEALKQAGSSAHSSVIGANATPQMGGVGGGGKIAINLAIAGIVGGAIWYANKK